MPLPNLEKIVPIFTLQIPSTSEDAQFRPFLVKEEKLLLIAMAGDDTSMHEAVSQIATSCVISPVKVESLANFDLEYIFLQLRAKSVNEFVDLTYKCHNEIVLGSVDIEARKKFIRFKKYVESLPEGSEVLGECENIVKIRLNLNDVKVQHTPEHTKIIPLTDTIGITMKYPNLTVSRMLNKSKQENQESTITDTIKTIAMCVESVYEGDSVYSGFTLKEMTEWIEKMTQSQFLKIQEFFETMPKLAHDVDFHCTKCDYRQTLHLEGLTSFFV